MKERKKKVSTMEENDNDNQHDIQNTTQQVEWLRTEHNHNQQQHTLTITEEESTEHS